MESPKLGQLITDFQQKDAVHFAIAPVTAYEDLLPGEDIGFTTSSQEIVGKTANKKLGIVDPFLRVKVKKGERFWMYLYPNTITSLRHDWEHPSFFRRSEANSGV